MKTAREIEDVICRLGEAPNNEIFTLVDHLALMREARDALVSMRSTAEALYAEIVHIKRMAEHPIITHQLIHDQALSVLTAHKSVLVAEYHGTKLHVRKPSPEEPDA